MKRSSTWVILFAVLAATAILVSLGAWQVRRLHWKEGLIAEVEARRHADPAPLDKMIATWQATHDVDYRAVTLSGSFDHSREVYFYTTREGAVGWDVLTPLRLENDGNATGWAIVDRGFVPDKMRDPATRPAGQVEGTLTVTGLARDPHFEKPNSFVPDNLPKKREFYWKDFAAIASTMHLQQGSSLVPFLIDAGPSDVPGGYPRGGSTIIAFPNNHLQYAITWFGLAAACAAIGGYFLFSRLRRSDVPPGEA